ncbi:hypothetical protein OH76DRAFT_1407985 [Lentinus brumalis]|uniref:3'-5' exonuclease domain-containing protein n=1 Tax=Lentinus brumalis TaxID=2498619 RepID=A0A371CZ84_9APHY|nr:hypothetical protein OH76DRAFT_1407985 [Polyporus brumalis]
MAAPNYTLCDTYESVVVAASTLSRSSILILDCEARDLARPTGVLSIVSISDVDATTIFLIDALALRDSSNPALVPLFDLLSSGTVTKLMWDGRADALELRETFGVELRGVLDLQLAEVVSRKSVRRETEESRLRRLATGYFKQMRHDILRDPAAYEGIDQVSGMKNSLKACGIHDSKDAAVVALHEAKGSAMWLQRPLPKALLQYAAHDLKLIAALYTSFVRAGWINGRDLPLLKEQSERYIRTLHTRALKDLFDQRNLGMFVSLHVIDTPPPDAQLYECESCHQQNTKTIAGAC